jgi:hypothetical protein
MVRPVKMPVTKSANCRHSGWSSPMWARIASRRSVLHDLPQAAAAGSEGRT